MSSIRSHIQPINIVFTPFSTAIYKDTPYISTEYLHIQVLPNNNGKNIGKIKIKYFDPNSSPSQFNEEINNNDIFESMAYSIIGSSEDVFNITLVDQIGGYLKKLPYDEISIIIKEYSNYIEDGILLDGFIAGISSYIVFLILNENSIFMNQMLFQLTIPFTIDGSSHEGNCNLITRNMFKYLSLPISALTKISNGVLLQLIIFIQSFINIWDPAFIDGPNIDNYNEAKICMEIISGLTNDFTNKLSKSREDYNLMMTNVSNIEKHLTSAIDDSLHRMKREINNLMIETRASIAEINTNITNHIDDNIKEKICTVIETQLDSQIRSKISSEIEDTKDRIEEIVSHYTINEGKKIVTEAVDKRESSLEGKLVGLEHRIEILYSSICSEPSENTTINDYSNIDKKLYSEITKGPTKHNEPSSPIPIYDEEVYSKGQKSDIFTINTEPSSDRYASITPISGEFTTTKKSFRTNDSERSIAGKNGSLDNGRHIVISRWNRKSNPRRYNN